MIIVKRKIEIDPSMEHRPEKKERHKRDRSDSERSRDSDDDDGDDRHHHRDRDEEKKKKHKKDKKSKKHKEEKKVEKVAKMLGYSNEINPFGDSNLLTPFVWGKKKEQDKSTSSHGEKDDQESKRLKLLSDIEKVRKRRQDRELELAEMERLRDEEQRLREMAAFGDWQKKEEEFHLLQTKERSRLRLLEMRPTDMDRVVQNLLMIECARYILNEYREITRKYSENYVKTDGDNLNNVNNINSINKLKEKQSELMKDAGLLLLDAELRSAAGILNSVHSDLLGQFYFELEQHKQLDEMKGGQYKDFYSALATVILARQKREKEQSISQLHESIAQDVEDLLKGKTKGELNELEEEIRKNLGPGKTVDIEYWELMLQEVTLQRARAELESYHVIWLQELLDLLSQLKDEGIMDELSSKKKTMREVEVSEDSTSMDEKAVEKYLRELELQRAFEETEAQMGGSDEVAVSAESYWWQDKYRPRKPRYFNRVRTGYDRTKYNLTHYDHDNPPPKMIQGYKFTIFYPDLIDKTKAPKYFIEPCPDAPNNEFVIIRFHAGPPYEDIAFKIVNKEWDVFKRAGFNSVFDRGILQLQFNFKRAFYRR